MGERYLPAALGGMERGRAVQWTVDVLCFSYHILFHHHLPLTQELREFPSHGSGPQKAQTLQEVNRMLKKGAVKIVEDGYLLYTACCF